MKTNAWIMQRDAIYAAKLCSKLIEEKFGLKLSLAHPAFISMLGDYAGLFDCEEITEAYRRLASYAPAQQANIMLEKIEDSQFEKRYVSPRRVSVQIQPDQIES
ncbi:MAG: hypothetical protein AAF542_02480 [Pseudomonadota bacterium]